MTGPCRAFRFLPAPEGFYAFLVSVLLAVLPGGLLSQGHLANGSLLTYGFL